MAPVDWDRVACASADFGRAPAIAKRIRTGTFGINDAMPINGDLPFGRCKHNSIGRAWGVEGVKEYLETKSLGWPA